MADAAKFQLWQAAFNRDNVQRNLVANLSSSYVEYLSLNDRLRVARETDAILSRMLDSLEKRVDDGDATLLTYDVKAQVGGKIAQLGARLIDATAKQMSDQFFDRFTAALTPPPAPVEAAAATSTITDVPDSALRPVPSLPVTALVPRQIFGLPPTAWAGIVLAIILLVALARGFF